MRTILLIMRKEFIQVFRDSTMLPIILLMPILQLLVLVNAASLDMKDIDLYIVDQDLSPMSGNLVSKFKASPFFEIQQQSLSLKDAQNRLKDNTAEAILNIPAGFEKELVKENAGKIQILINAIDGTAAGLINIYSANVINDFNQEVRTELINFSSGARLPQKINVIGSFWYNPDMNYKIYMLPGIIVILVTVIGMFLTAINLVREKEMGTIEQINVTPIKKQEFIIGKLLPFWVISLFELGFGLLIGKILYDVPFVGSIPLLFGFAALYLVLMLGIGLFISTVSNTQQQVMFIAFFFMLVFIMMSGIFTPVESMPDWAIKFNIINPIAYFMKAIRMIMLKGSGFKDVMHEMLYLAIYGVLILSLAVARYRKVA